MINVTEVTAVDHHPRELCVAIEPEILRDHEGAAGLLRGFRDLGRVLEADGHGLLKKHVLARFERLDRDLGVKVVRHRNNDRFDVRLLE